MGNKIEFKIGDRVRVKPRAELSEEMTYKNMRADCSEGVIEDIMWSQAKSTTVYKLHFDGKRDASRIEFLEGSFDLIVEEKPTYTYEFDVCDNVVVAIMYEIKTDSKEEIARGHGHIIHEGAVGIAQASSYALTRVLEKLNNGKKHFLDEKRGKRNGKFIAV